MTLPVNVVKEVRHTDPLLDVPQEHMTIVTGGEQDVLISGIRLQNIQLVFVTPQDAMQLGCLRVPDFNLFQNARN